jgi:hypothetical protein
MVAMPDAENWSIGIRRSRRNLIKMGTIATSVMLASMKTELAYAQNGQGGNGQGGNGQGQNGQGGHGRGSCFLRGTTIRTADGDKKIEDLAVGNLLPTVFGGLRPIQWIGRYHFRKPDPTKAWVKYILQFGLPGQLSLATCRATDLFVTKPHAVLVDDVLVPVCNLINGTTIAVYDAGGPDELDFSTLSSNITT